MDAITSYLLERWPILLWGLIIIIATAFLTYKVVKWYYTRYTKVEEKVKQIDKLPCLKHEMILCEMKNDLAIIRAFIMAKYPSAAPVFSHKSSPRILNDAGEQLFDDIKGVEFLKDNGDFLIKCIDDKAPKTALDVEESALQVLYDNFDNDMFVDAKNWVYNSPSRRLMIDGVEKEYYITMNDVCFVLSLPLRNMYLEKHPELNSRS